MRPLRTMPGNPADTRSKAGSGLTMSTSTVTSFWGDMGYGVGMRTRSCSIWPASSSTAAFSPVPPMSMASVERGRAGAADRRGVVLRGVLRLAGWGASSPAVTGVAVSGGVVEAAARAEKDEVEAARLRGERGVWLAMPPR